MRQHEPKCADRACGAPMRQLSIYFFGDGPFLQHNRDDLFVSDNGAMKTSTSRLPIRGVEMSIL